MLIFFVICIEGLNLTTFLAVILASTLVSGFLPILSFFCETLKVPNEEILILLNFSSSERKNSKKLSIINEEKFFEKPRFWYILSLRCLRVKFFFSMI
ncbi:uncharacterized protein METZ01_LOCUS436324 [marine metagenome]|uniref:Uncharacterized protein n=1 Tax=marine metagenome TaxID=408172 RepID=A0A382YK80_9ZZZZ